MRGDKFKTFGITKSSFWSLIFMVNGILMLTMITYIKVLVIWLPGHFRIIQTLCIKFINAKTLILLLWVIYVLFIPVIVVFVLLSPLMDGFSSMVISIIRILLMSNGGFLFNQRVEFGLAENIDYLVEQLGSVYILYIVVAIPVLINIFITGVYVAAVLDSLRQARFEDKRLADQQMKY